MKAPKNASSLAVVGAWLAAVVLAAPGLAQAAGGTVTGKVDATPPKYLAETVVYLKGVKAEAAPKTVSMDQKGMAFVPHVLAIKVGDTVNFLNHDGVDHNVFTPDNEGYNLGMFKSGESRNRTFQKPGVYTQLCSVHPEMLAFIFVGENEHMAVVDKAGHYTLKNVPPGTYQIAVWNSKLKAPEQSVTVAEGKTVEVSFSVKR